ncbi:hypothetical protein HFN69_35025 [Rhizobium laguerreae]|uniref:SIR2 family protein n=1 Tax=Rhizobium laguerreae TaxID=1076926 RepID=UPI001C9114D7|nr:SIR2 family protein [Rhizobium laguerreae]MBY3551705.1 hypothetical protein [Rhizobium laguerreae]
MPISFEEILDIPENRATFENLKRDLTKAICFVGAGASAPMYPLWGTLLEGMYQRAIERGENQSSIEEQQADNLTPQQQADIIRERLREPWYREHLEKAFRSRRNPDGSRYTATHASLLSHPFKGYLTTNYDEGLAFAREAVRQQCATVGTPTWMDLGIVGKWLDGKAFEEEDACPILWLHGVISQSITCVLSTADYEDTYNLDKIQDLFRLLWYRERLVFVGVSFNDPFLVETLRDFLPGYLFSGGAPRHYAFVGVSDEDLADSDFHQKITVKRSFFETEFNVMPIFYPVHNHDHGGLATLLNRLPPLPKAQTMPGAETPPVVRGSLRASYWVHAPTNDDRFIGRSEEIARLNRFARDPAVRCIGVTAVGGTGKTSLIGHWLGGPDEWQLPTHNYLFAWSFGEDSSSERFLASLVGWARRESLLPKSADRESDDLRDALSLLESQSVVLVIDGLEVSQEGPGGEEYGSLLDSRLKKLATEVCRSKRSNSLLVLTSRFGFSDLERFTGTSCKQLFLDGLEQNMASTLLEDLGVAGTDAERREVAENLDGHPLALRIFAEALPEEFRSAPLTFWRSRMSTASRESSSPLYKRLNDLLSFYETQLTPIQHHLLSTISLFNKPINESRLTDALKQLFPQTSELTEPVLKSELATLRRRDLVMTQMQAGTDPDYFCHPVLSDYFRARLIADSVAAHGAVDLMTSNSELWEAWTLESLENFIQAIQILIEIGEIPAAQQRYSYSNPGIEKIRDIDGESIALTGELAFIGSERLRQECKDAGLTDFDIAAHLHAASVFTSDQKAALQLSKDAYQFIEKSDVGNYIEVGYSLANTYESLGFLEEALSVYDDIVSKARKNKSRKLSCALVGRSVTLLTMGRVSEALQDIFAADLNDRSKGLDSNARSCGHNLSWVHLLMITKRLDLAEKRLDQVAAFARLRDVETLKRECACCRANLLLESGRVPEARASVNDFSDRASPTSVSTNELICLSRSATLEGDVGSAVDNAERAMSEAQNNYEKLSLIDALTARAEAMLMSNKSDERASALDDLDHAMAIAAEVGSEARKLSVMRLIVSYYVNHADETHEGDPNIIEEKRNRSLQELDYLERLFTLGDDTIQKAANSAEKWLEVSD